MPCAKCGQSVPEDAIYCPHCVARRPVSERQVINAGLKGGTLGLAFGLVLLTVLLVNAEPERGLKGLLLAIPLATFATGLIIGLVRGRRDWK